MTRAEERMQLAREARAREAFRQLERHGVGAIISRRALAEREPLSEYSTIRGRALLAYYSLLATIAAVAGDLERGHPYRQAVARELRDVRSALRRADAARRALLAGQVEP